LVGTTTKIIVGSACWLFAGVLLASMSLANGPISRGTECPPPNPCDKPKSAWVSPVGQCGLSNYICCTPDEIGYWGDALGNGTWTMGICCPEPTLSCNWTAVWTSSSKTKLDCDCGLDPCDPSGVEPCD
jgi:hypothetical protein